MLLFYTVAQEVVIHMKFHVLIIYRDIHKRAGRLQRFKKLGKKNFFQNILYLVLKKIKKTYIVVKKIISLTNKKMVIKFSVVMGGGKW